MTKIPPTEFNEPYQARLKTIEAERRCVQERYEKDYERALVDLREEIKAKEGEEMEEEMKEDIRKWFFDGRHLINLRI